MLTFSLSFHGLSSPLPPLQTCIIVPSYFICLSLIRCICSFICRGSDTPQAIEARTRVAYLKQAVDAYEAQEALLDRYINDMEGMLKEVCL